MASVSADTSSPAGFDASQSANPIKTTTVRDNTGRPRSGNHTSPSAGGGFRTEHISTGPSLGGRARSPGTAPRQWQQQQQRQTRLDSSPCRHQHLAGGRRLGGPPCALALGPDKAALAVRARQQSHPVARHIITRYADGIFTVNGGEPQDVRNEASRKFMEDIGRGVCPASIETDGPDTDTAVQVVYINHNYQHNPWMLLSRSSPYSSSNSSSRSKPPGNFFARSAVASDAAGTRQQGAALHVSPSFASHGNATFPTASADATSSGKASSEASLHPGAVTTARQRTLASDKSTRISVVAHRDEATASLFSQQDRSELPKGDSTDQSSDTDIDDNPFDWLQEPEPPVTKERDGTATTPHQTKQRAADAQASIQPASDCGKQTSIHDDRFICAISHELMRDPVLAADGFTYEREQIEMWIKRSETSPMTNTPLEHPHLVPDMSMRQAISDMLKAEARNGR